MLEACRLPKSYPIDSFDYRIPETHVFFQPFRFPNAFTIHAPSILRIPFGKPPKPPSSTPTYDGSSHGLRSRHVHRQCVGLQHLVHGHVAADLPVFVLRHRRLLGAEGARPGEILFVAVPGFQEFVLGGTLQLPVHLEGLGALLLPSSWRFRLL